MKKWIFSLIGVIALTLCVQLTFAAKKPQLTAQPVQQVNSLAYIYLLC